MAGKISILWLKRLSIWPAVLCICFPNLDARAATILAFDLSKAFGAPKGWRFLATQDGPVADPERPDLKIPGTIRLCLKNALAAACDAAILATPRPPPQVEDSDWEPHYLKDARVVFPRGRSRPPLLLVQSASAPSIDGDELVFTQILTYRRQSDRFERIYQQATGRNNNQEVRYINSGPLAGDVIFAESTTDAPFGFWVSVHRLLPGYIYRQVLRYRSATHYNDGNALAVIDSEMPNIQKRLGLWKQGSPLPLPAGPCPKPRLIKMELWCR